MSKDGGSAFGSTGNLTVRDYFAIHAPADEVKIIWRHFNISPCAARYRWADDMLKAREQ